MLMDLAYTSIYQKSHGNCWHSMILDSKLQITVRILTQNLHSKSGKFGGFQIWPL